MAQDHHPTIGINVAGLLNIQGVGALPEPMLPDAEYSRGGRTLCRP